MDTTADALITMMVGRELKDFYQKKHPTVGDVILEVKNFSRQGIFSDIYFQLRQGEILGVAGLVGAGRSEVARALFGIDQATSGEIFISGRQVKIASPQEAIKLGFAMVTEDRARSGLILGMQLFHNISLVILSKLCLAGFIRMKKDDLTCRSMIHKLQIKISDRQQLANQLSGGNQQKAILAKWLLVQPRILILDEPTRGIDVGSKSEIYGLMSELAQQGLAILMISSELPEILGMSDRIIVIRDGRQVLECDRAEASQEKIMKFAFGG